MAKTKIKISEDFFWFEVESVYLSKKYTVAAPNKKAAATIVSKKIKQETGQYFYIDTDSVGTKITNIGKVHIQNDKNEINCSSQNGLLIKPNSSKWHCPNCGYSDPNQFISVCPNCKQ